MKAIINGRTYNTGTAKRVWSWDNRRTDRHYQKVSAYRMISGEYFIVGEGGSATVWAHTNGSIWVDAKNKVFAAGIKVYPISGGIGYLLEQGGDVVRFTNTILKSCQVGEMEPGFLEIFLGGENFSAPAAENSGVRIG